MASRKVSDALDYASARLRYWPFGADSSPEIERIISRRRLAAWTAVAPMMTIAVARGAGSDYCYGLVLGLWAVAVAFAAAQRPGSRTALPSWRSSCQTSSHCPRRYRSSQFLDSTFQDSAAPTRCPRQQPDRQPDATVVTNVNQGWKSAVMMAKRAYGR